MRRRRRRAAEHPGDSASPDNHQTVAGDGRATGRRELLRATVAGVAASAAGCVDLLSGASDGRAERPERDSEPIDGDWGMTHADAQNARHTAAGGPVDGDREGWERELATAAAAGPIDGNCGPSDRALPVPAPAGPVIAGDLVYVTEKRGAKALADIDAGTGPVVRVLEAATGERYESSPLDGVVGVPMAATADAVFVGTVPTEQSEVAEIDPESGTARWHCPLPGPRVHLSSVTDESVYLNVGETVYAVDRSDGAIRWGSETNGRYVFAAAVGRDGVYVTTRGRVIGFDRATDEERWSRWLDEQVTAAPVVADGLVLVGRTGGITAFDRSGDREWTSGMVRQAVHALGTTDGTVYSTSRDLLSSFDLQSGGLRAFFDLRSSEVLEDRFPVDATVRVSVTDEVLYIAGERKVAGFDRETVEPAETWSLDKSVQWGPAVAGDLAFVTTRADGERESRTLRALGGG